MITKDNNLKVMELFFKYPYRTFHIRELARLTGLSSTGIIKIVARLKRERMIITKKTKNIEEVKPDFEGRFLLMKRLYNIYSLYDSNVIANIKDFYEMPKAIILFGSYSEGTDTEKSDIDIAVITKNKNLPDIKKFEGKLARKISIHAIDLESASKGFKNSIANGIILEGFIEFIK